MLQFITIVLIVGQCYAYYMSGTGFGTGYGSAIPAAVHSIWKLEVKPIKMPQEPIVPQVIEVPPLELPVKILYHSKSSGVFVEQMHHPGQPGQSQTTRTEEEPHRLRHEVIRPVIQELREFIVPYRHVVQEIAPVIQEVQTIVSRGEGRQNSLQSGGGGIISSKGRGATMGVLFGGMGDLGNIRGTEFNRIVQGGSKIGIGVQDTTISSASKSFGKRNSGAVPKQNDLA